jgi:GDP-4-dehydro-6-deoxy-D-mannose reductase
MGFAGSHLAEHLLRCGDEILGSSRSGNWPHDMPADVSAAVEVLRWDVTQAVPPNVRRRIQRFQPQCIYHLAAISVPADCGRHDPTATALATNVAGTRSLLELAASLPLQPRVLLASSCYVYRPVTFDEPIVNEHAALAPTSAYGKTKLAAEDELRTAWQQSKLDGVIARAFQHAGPRQSPRMILPDWAEQFAKDGNEPVRVQCMDTFLDLTDVRDIVRAYRDLVLHGTRGQVYNVGSGICRRSGDVFQQLRQMAAPQRPFVELSPGRRQHPIADITRLATETTWQPTIPWEKTLADILTFWRSKKIT